MREQSEDPYTTEGHQWQVEDLLPRFETLHFAWKIRIHQLLDKHLDNEVREGGKSILPNALLHFAQQSLFSVITETEIILLCPGKQP